MAKPINEKVVGDLTAPPRRHYFGGSKFAGQVAPAGFGVDVLPSGTKSFFLHYRRDGRPSRPRGRLAERRTVVGGSGNPKCS
jgi:hypothetical protein